MTRAPVPPTLGAESFSCPHCGAHAHQQWFMVLLKGCDKDSPPSLFSEELLENLRRIVREDPADAVDLGAFLDRYGKHRFTYWESSCRSSNHWEMVNTALSRCFACDAFSVWVEGRIVYPARESPILPHEDMPSDVKVDFLEAAEIVDRSPRSAAALLRLAIQKLMPHIGEKGDNLNASIAKLVKTGLDKKVQQALDIVRVTGNNAVHPGELDLKDDKATALQLFALVNIVVQSTISAQAQIDAMYAGLPPGALSAIRKRDGSSDGDNDVTA